MLTFDKFSLIDVDSPIPKYHQLATSILESIKKGKFALEEKLPPERELASYFKVSYLTARQAVGYLEKKGILKRVHGKGTFVSNNTENIEKEIYFVIPGLSSPVAQIMEGIENVLTGESRHLTVFNCCFNLDKEQEYIRKISNTPNSSLIWYPAEIEGKNNRKLFNMLIKKNYPVIFVDHVFEGAECSSVLTDDFHGAGIAVEHLIKRGHKKVACLTSANIQMTSVKKRIDGYCHMLTECGIIPQKNLIKHLSFTKNIMEENIDETSNIIQDWMKMEKPPTAIFTTSGEVASVALKVAHERGIKVPDDLAIISYGDPENVFLQILPLSAIKVPRQDIGIEAAKLILLKDMNSLLVNTQIVLEPTLIIRKST